jgi:hypothetical protein
MILEGNNDQGEEDMQIEVNINVGLMQHLEQSTPDPAFEDYMARKCFLLGLICSLTMLALSLSQKFGLLSSRACY